MCKTYSCCYEGTVSSQCVVPHLLQFHCSTAFDAGKVNFYSELHVIWEEAAVS